MAAVEAEVTTSASPARVWTVLVDVERWPAWSDSYTSARRLDDGPLRVGSQARLKQPGLAASRWEVTDLAEPREFTWFSTAPGVRTVACHRLIAEPGGGTRIRLDLDQAGPLAGLVSALLGARIRRYVQMEADGLKAASEATGEPAA